MDEREIFETSSGIPLKPIYRAEDLQDFDYSKNLNDAGSYPYTRGIYPEMYRNRLWVIRVLSGEKTPIDSNKQFKRLVKEGETGLDVIGDTPTMTQIDADHPLAEKAVGLAGIPACCLQDYRELFDGLPLDKVSFSASMPGFIFIPGLYISAKELGFSPNMIRGSLVQAPFYCEDSAYGSRQPFNMRVRGVVDGIEFCTKEMAKFHPFLEDVYYISENALDSVKEIALGLVEARYIIKKTLERGLDIDDFAPNIAMLVTSQMDFFEQIAKIRALRRIWAQMMKEEFGAKEPRSLRLTVTVHTSGLSLTPRQLPNNIVRGTLQALASVFAGVQAIEVSAFDEPYRIPSPEADVVSLRSQQVIAYESGIAKVVDPFGGSYFMESLTNEIEDRIRGYVKKIEDMGDPAKPSEEGAFRAIFDDATVRYHQEVTEGKRKIVGENIFVIPDEDDTLLRGVAEEKFEPIIHQIQRIKELRRTRDNSKVKETLQEIYIKAGKERENLMYPIIRALESDATMGEITGAIRLGYNCSYDPFGMIEPPFSISG